MMKAAESPLQYLSPAVLSRISGLELRARLAVEGYFSGMHHSPHHGFSIEFADHRAYSQGDDLRHIDWKVFGRTDKYYIKEYEQEANINLLLAVDCSESMDFRSDHEGMTKLDFAATVAACIAYLAIRQQDSIGLALFDDRIREFLKPSNSAQQWKIIARELARPPGPAKTSLGPVLTELAERLSHRTLLILISDLFDDPGEIIRGLKWLRYRRHEPLVWNVWDAAELSFPFDGLTRFEGVEGMGTLLTDAGSIRNRYLAEVNAFQGRLRQACGTNHVDYVVFDTSRSIGAALAGYLATRSATSRHRAARIGAGGSEAGSTHE